MFNPCCKKVQFGIMLGVFSLIALGCTHSRLWVDSDPPGAQVYFDGKPKGETPVDFKFQWYGSHRIKLRKVGYQEIDIIENLGAPLHYQIPLDLVTTIIPVTIPDRHFKSYSLQAIATSD